jgi:transposase
MKIAFYESSLSDDQWAFIEPMIPKPKWGSDAPRTDPSRILDSILHIAKNGIQIRGHPIVWFVFQCIVRAVCPDSRQFALSHLR